MKQDDFPKGRARCNEERDVKKIYKEDLVFPGQEATSRPQTASKPRLTGWTDPELIHQGYIYDAPFIKK